MTGEQLKAWVEDHKTLGRAPYLEPGERTRYVVDVVELLGFIEEHERLVSEYENK